MGMVVQHNMNALTAYNKLNTNVAGLKKSSEKLASGYRINRAGDDAAGLAISEKMRSQIKGLNQAIRNSQDGINMVQTFEGAAQETHSILQRMKELASESANGTYDNATDRAAIQLEFDQLNDELNQIADTDFNGTVVLNGGVMADGTVAKNGEFNYANGYTETVVAANATDISGAQSHTMADQSFYDKDKADAVYDAVGVDVSDYQKIGVTFMYDGERWVSDTVTDASGNVIEGARAAGLEARTVERDNASGVGGFEVIAGRDAYTGEDIVATNVIFDEMTPVLKKGDTITVYFDNSAEETYAPKNVGLDEDHAGTDVGKAFKFDDDTQEAIDDGTSTLSYESLAGKISFELDAGITDEAMTPELKLALEALDGIDITIEYEDGAVKTDSYAIDKTEIDAGDNSALKAAAAKITIDTDDGTVYYGTKGEDGTITLGKITAEAIQIDKAAYTETKWSVGTVGNVTGITAPDDPTTGTADTMTISLTTDAEKQAFLDDTNIKALLKSGVTSLTFTSTSANAGSFTVTDNLGNTTTLTKAQVASATGLNAQHNDGSLNGASFTIAVASTQVDHAAEKTNDEDADGTFTISLNVDAFNYADMTNLTVHTAATPKVATMAYQVADAGVTKANAFNNSTARLTYTDNITLQTGARTKDAVNFNFSYNTDDSADMGDLLANLDLSARSTGLNTANLSLANQDDANYAIDQIDKAINKTSMVRATFGSIQNRLEHKITNLTTTSENLTEAESSIRDTDMASEMMNYTKYNILQQAAQSMLAQANQQPQSILQLLG